MSWPEPFRKVLLCIVLAAASVLVEEGRVIPFFAVSLHLYEVSFILATALFGAPLGVLTALLTVAGIIFLSSNPGDLSYIHAVLYAALCIYMAWRMKTGGRFDIFTANRSFWLFIGMPTIILLNYPLFEASLSAGLLTLVAEAGSSLICALIVQILFFSERIISLFEKVRPGIASQCHWDARQIGSVLAIVAAAIPAAVAMQLLYSDPLQNRLSRAFNTEAVKASFAKQLLELRLVSLTSTAERVHMTNATPPGTTAWFEKFPALCQVIRLEDKIISTNESTCKVAPTVKSKSDIPQNLGSLIALHETQLKSGMFTLHTSLSTSDLGSSPGSNSDESIHTGFIITLNTIYYEYSDSSAEGPLVDFHALEGTIYQSEAIFEKTTYTPRSRILQDSDSGIDRGVTFQPHLLARLTEKIAQDAPEPIRLPFMSVRITAVKPINGIAKEVFGSLALVSMVILIMTAIVAWITDRVAIGLLRRISDYKLSLTNWKPGDPYTMISGDSIADDFNDLNVIVQSHMERINSQIHELEDTKLNLEEIEAEQRTVLEVIAKPIFVVSESGEITSKNPSGENFISEYPFFLDSFPISDDGEKKDTQVAAYIYHSVVSGLSIQNLNWISVDTGGDQKTYLLSIEPAILSGKSVAVVVLEDVTAFDLMKKKLAHASRLATLGELTTGVAHEINQPLNAIMLSSASLKNRVDDLDITSSEKFFLEGKLTKIVDQVKRAAKIISNLKAFGRDIPEEKEVIYSNQIMENCTDLVAEQLRSDGFTLHHVPLAAKKRIKVNLLSIEQVLINVLNNASDAMKEQGIKSSTIDIREETLGSFFVIRITNPSDPLPNKVLEKIFDPFFTTKEVGKGTGLGMSISYGIISDHGGDIVIQNVAGGVCVTISLPIYHEQNM